MSDELFDPQAVTVPSPRLAWLQRYAVKTFDHGEPIEDEAGDHERWHAEGRIGLGMPHVAEGETEHDVIVALALKMKVRLWNEENLK